MFVSTLPRIALVAVSLFIAFGTAQAQTPRIGEPAPSASKTQRADARVGSHLKAKTKARAKVSRSDARRNAALKRRPKGQRVHVNGRRPTIARPAAAPSAAQLKTGPRGQRINGAPAKKRTAQRVSQTPNVRVRSTPTGRTRTPVRRAADRVDLRRCTPGDTRVECRQQRIRHR